VVDVVVGVVGTVGWVVGWVVVDVGGHSVVDVELVDDVVVDGPPPAHGPLVVDVVLAVGVDVVLDDDVGPAVRVGLVDEGAEVVVTAAGVT
jgi:hypothetical protein